MHTQKIARMQTTGQVPLCCSRLSLAVAVAVAAAAAGLFDHSGKYSRMPFPRTTHSQTHAHSNRHPSPHLHSTVNPVERYMRRHSFAFALSHMHRHTQTILANCTHKHTLTTSAYIYIYSMVDIKLKPGSWCACSIVHPSIRSFVRSFVCMRERECAFDSVCVCVRALAYIVDIYGNGGEPIHGAAPSAKDSRSPSSQQPATTARLVGVALRVCVCIPLYIFDTHTNTKTHTTNTGTHKYSNVLPPKCAHTNV